MVQQVHATQAIIKIMNGIPYTTPTYNLEKALIVWNLPSSLLREMGPRTTGRGGGRGGRGGSRRGRGRRGNRL